MTEEKNFVDPVSDEEKCGSYWVQNRHSRWVEEGDTQHKQNICVAEFNLKPSSKVCVFIILLDHLSSLPSITRAKPIPTHQCVLIHGVRSIRSMRRPNINQHRKAQRRTYRPIPLYTKSRELALEYGNLILRELLRLRPKIEVDQEQHNSNIYVWQDEHIDRARKHLFCFTLRLLKSCYQP